MVELHLLQDLQGLNVLSSWLALSTVTAEWRRKSFKTCTRAAAPEGQKTKHSTKALNCCRAYRMKCWFALWIKLKPNMTQTSTFMLFTSVFPSINSKRWEWISFSLRNIQGETSLIKLTPNVTETHLVHKLQLLPSTDESICVDEAATHWPWVENHVSGNTDQDVPIVTRVGESTSGHTEKHQVQHQTHLYTILLV